MTNDSNSNSGHPAEDADSTRPFGKPASTTNRPNPWSDLRNRSLTAVVALAVVYVFIRAGDSEWTFFVITMSILVFREWVKLVSHRKKADYFKWFIFGVIYVFFNAFLIIDLRGRPNGALTLYAIIVGVVSTDTSAYFFGRWFGGMKIAPKISPSKTWSGLIGGCIGASISLIGFFYYISRERQFFGSLEILNNFGDIGLVVSAVATGVILASVAQAGDFFESWMKRRAGMKDSGSLLPGHGGVFDRVDGLLSVTLVAGIVELSVDLLSAGP